MAASVCQLEPVLMRGWFWVCDITALPALWREWRVREVASLGWAPDYLAANPAARDQLDVNLRTLKGIAKGDRIIAYLKHGRIGGIGTFDRVLHTDDDSWNPITEGDHGRLARVAWDSVPAEGMYSQAPESTTQRRLPTIRRIADRAILEALEEAVRNPDTWAPLSDSSLLTSSECAELHLLILANLGHLERGLAPGPWGPPHEFPADGIGTIDLLVADANGLPVVIEAKSYSADDAVLGQLARYMGWIRLRLRPRPAGVRGIIVAGEFTPKTKFGASVIPGVELFSYQKSSGDNIRFQKIQTKMEEEVE